MRVRWLRWMAYGALLGVGAALGLTATVRLSFAGTETTVPSVTGLTQDQGKFQATRSRLRFQVLSERYDLNAARGQIVSQEPPPGTVTRRHRTLGVVVSKGVDRMPMPALVGDRMDQAQVKVRQAGLKLASVGYVHAAAEPHCVVAQSPPGDSVVSREMGVSILVSLGPAQLSFVTPALVGRSYAPTKAALQEFGLQMGSARTVKVPGQPPDTILAQNPQAGTPLSRRDVVQVSVNRP